MNRSTARSFVFAAASAIVAMVPMTSAGAQSISAATPEQVRSQYIAEGFITSQPTTWWTDGSTSFTVADPLEQTSPSARVLMVIVYPSAAVAQTRNGAHIVPGYGPSTIQGNVALMQTTRTDLARRYAAELNNDDPTYDGASNPAMLAEDPNDRVGVDFLAVLQSEAVNL